MKDIPLADEAATEQLGRLLADALPALPLGWLVTLSGELGAGKSTLARAMIRHFGHHGPVPSPTYTLIEPYEIKHETEGYMLYHVDLYRIADPDELHFMGWSDLDDGLRVVEWPERAPALSASADLAVTLAVSGQARLATLASHSERGAATVERITARVVSEHSGTLS